ncbi:MAG: hypothetical protein ACYTGB_13655, partial [Planctomycetota bacterium]
MSRRKAFAAALSVLFGMALPAAAAAPGGRAGELLRASGVSAGFCVHVGADDGVLVGELAASPGLLVQGLVPEGASAEKARAHLVAKKLNARASVIAASFKRLPYVDDLVSLLVVEDLAAAQAKGLSLREVVRV